MCGIAGFVGGNWSRSSEAKSILVRMTEALRHRGPDRSDTWFDAEAEVGFAHSRLSIVDLSAAGNQPMWSQSGRFVIVYNGEIYNHQNIRGELGEAGQDYNWKGHSDTETLLAAIEAWGVRRALERSTGMFAFALWDKEERTLVLARDRLGEKPLYYGRQRPGGPFLFGSELKALARHPEFQPEVSREVLSLLLRYAYVPAPFSIYEGIRKLPAGSLLTLRRGRPEPEIHQYWSASAVAEAGVANPLALGPEETAVELERLLDVAISRQMIADVPLGAFLSGGIDSSTVVALMQKHSSRPVKTFTIGFHEEGYDEAKHAKAVATHLGTEHTQLYVNPKQARAVIPRLPAIYDEPFADPSQIPTHLVAELAREHVAVALSGDGGDEMFGGYNRYGLSAGVWNKIAGVPKPLRTTAARAMTAIPPSAWTKLGNAASGMLPKAMRVDRLGDKVHKGASLLGSQSVAELYSGMISLWREPGSLVRGVTEPPSQATGHTPALRGLGGIERMMALDMLGYLPDDILVKVDRAAMAVSLETRVPYLDHNVVEFAWRLPFGLKIRNGETKWIIRQILCHHVPRELIERPKMGFGVPIGAWLRGPLREWAEELLDERRLRDEGYFRSEPIRNMWKAHLSGKVDEQYRLWVILMFQAWLESDVQFPSQPVRTAAIAG